MRFSFSPVPLNCFLFLLAGVNCLLINPLRLPYRTFKKTLFFVFDLGKFKRLRVLKNFVSI